MTPGGVGDPVEQLPANAEQRYLQGHQTGVVGLREKGSRGSHNE